MLFGLQTEHLDSEKMLASLIGDELQAFLVGRADRILEDFHHEGISVTCHVEGYDRVLEEFHHEFIGDACHVGGYAGFV